MSSCNSHLVTVDPYSHLSKETNCSDKEEHGFYYREAAGSHIYAIICTRPEIAYAVSKVAQFSNNPKSVHLMAEKRTFSYLNGKINHEMCFGGIESGKNTRVLYRREFCSQPWWSTLDYRSTSDTESWACHLEQSSPKMDVFVYDGVWKRCCHSGIKGSCGDAATTVHILVTRPSSVVTIKVQWCQSATWFPSKN